MTAPQRRADVLATRYGIAIVVLLVFSLLLTPLYNSLAPVLGMPLFVFVGVVLVPIVSIAITWIYRAALLRASEEGGEQR